MRIAYISTIKNSSWGGSEELWHQSAIHALQQKHIIGVFVYDWGKEPLKITQLKKDGAFIYKRRRGIRPGWGMLERILKRMGISEPDFLNGYNSLYDFKPDIIVVTDGGTYYASDDKWLSKILTNFKKKYIIICQANGAYRMPARRATAITLFKNSKKVVFVSENNRQQTYHQLACSDFDSVVIQNPINISAFECAAIPTEATAIVHFAVVGRFSVADKGQDIVIAVMAEEYWRRSNVVVHLYGAGSDESYLKDLIHYYKVEDKVVIEGHARAEEIWHTCHCLVMPSIAEGTPLTLLEAMMLGRVCIVSNVGGNSEWIIDRENGYLAEAPAQKLMSEKMKDAFENITSWQAVSANAKTVLSQRNDSHPGLTLLKHVTE